MACVAENEGRIPAVAGEPLDSVSRESQVPAHELEHWQRTFIEGGMQGLNRPVAPEDREFLRTRAKLGALIMRLELAEGFHGGIVNDRYCRLAHNTR